MIKNIVGACIRVCHWTRHSSRIISFNYKLCFLLDLCRTPSRWFSGEKPSSPDIIQCWQLCFCCRGFENGWNYLIKVLATLLIARSWRCSIRNYFLHLFKRLMFLLPARKVKNPCSSVEYTRLDYDLSRKAIKARSQPRILNRSADTKRRDRFGN